MQDRVKVNLFDNKVIVKSELQDKKSKALLSQDSYFVQFYNENLK